MVAAEVMEANNRWPLPRWLAFSSHVHEPVIPLQDASDIHTTGVRTILILFQISSNIFNQFPSFGFSGCFHTSIYSVVPGQPLQADRELENLQVRLN